MTIWYNFITTFFLLSSFAKLNIILPEEFMEAPTAVSKALMMKQNLEDGVKVEVAQAEKINSNMKLNENKENWKFARTNEAAIIF